MNFPNQLLRRRPALEQRAITILRCFAGNHEDRDLGLLQVRERGGSRATTTALARLIAIALAFAHDIRAVRSPYVSGDELNLIYQLSKFQREDNITKYGTGDFADALSSAASAFRTIGIQFPWFILYSTSKTYL